MQDPVRSSALPAAAQITDLCYSYPDCPDVLQSINLTIQKGERVGIVGPNGAGKTTLFLSMCGVLAPSRGDIVLFDQPVHPGDFRPEIGLVFQNPADQLFSLSVQDDIAFGPLNMGLEPDEVDRRVRRALMLTGIEELGERPPHHLSGGQRRMVAIATVLAMMPQLVIYDEPSANLDIRSRRRLIKFLLNSEETFLVSSHDLELVREVCDRVIVLDEGQIVADGITDEIMGDEPLMEHHGLEVPHSLRYHYDPHHD
jgi:cobalt/nickel transport system ATP-binding protein